MLDPLTSTIGPLPVTTCRKPGETEDDHAKRHRERVRALLASMRSHAGMTPVPYKTRRGL